MGGGCSGPDHNEKFKGPPKKNLLLNILSASDGPGVCLGKEKFYVAFLRYNGL